VEEKPLGDEQTWYSFQLFDLLFHLIMERGRAESNTQALLFYQCTKWNLKKT